MRGRRIATTVCTVLAMLGGGMIITAAPAAAGNCSAWVSGSQGFASCFGMRGYVRVFVRCDGGWWSSDYFRVGRWADPEIYSSEADCDSGDDAVSADHEFRGTPSDT